MLSAGSRYRKMTEAPRARTIVSRSAWLTLHWMKGLQLRLTHRPPHRGHRGIDNEVSLVAGLPSCHELCNLTFCRFGCLLLSSNLLDTFGGLELLGFGFGLLEGQGCLVAGVAVAGFAFVMMMSFKRIVFLVLGLGPNLTSSTVFSPAGFDALDAGLTAGVKGVWMFAT